MLVGGIVMFLMGAFAVLAASSQLKKARMQLLWLRTSALIVESEVQDNYEGYTPKITYEYEYQNVKFVGQTYKSVLVTYNWKGPSERIVQRYRPGNRVSIYINPIDPSNSVLELGGFGVHQFLIAISAIAMLAGLVLLLYALT
jgi:Protein of unknown function (DUF3592)